MFRLLTALSLAFLSAPAQAADTFAPGGADRRQILDGIRVLTGSDSVFEVGALNSLRTRTGYIAYVEVFSSKKEAVRPFTGWAVFEKKDDIWWPAIAFTAAGSRMDCDTVLLVYQVAILKFEALRLAEGFPLSVEIFPISFYGSLRSLLGQEGHTGCQGTAYRLKP